MAVISLDFCIVFTLSTTTAIQVKKFLENWLKLGNMPFIITCFSDFLSYEKKNSFVFQVQGNFLENIQSELLQRG